MKCIKDIKSGRINRVSDSTAKSLVEKGEAEYVKKEEWKKIKKENEK